MFSSTSGLARTEESSGSGSNLSIFCHFNPLKTHGTGSNVSLFAAASEEDDEVRFDSKRFLALLPNRLGLAS